MKYLRRICAGFLLILALSIPALAGDIASPGFTDGPQESPGATDPGETQGPGYLGDISSPGIAIILALLP